MTFSPTVRHRTLSSTRGTRAQKCPQFDRQFLSPQALRYYVSFCLILFEYVSQSLEVPPCDYLSLSIWSGEPQYEAQFRLVVTVDEKIAFLHL